MKFLLVSDLHGQKNTPKLLERVITLEKPNALICCGDLTTYDEIDFVDKVFEVFESSRIPCFTIWGNCDMPNVRKKILGSLYNIHLKLKKVGNDKIYGIADTDDLPQISPEFIAGSILVTHRPPAKVALDVKFSGAPRFHVCGHIHYQAKQTDYLSTSLIQVPSLTLNRYAILDTKTSLARFKRI